MSRFAKKGSVVLLAVIMALALYGCGSSNNGASGTAPSASPGGSQPAANKPETITLMINASWWTPIMDEIAKAAEAATGVKVDVQKIPEGAEGQKIIKTKMSANELSDMFGWAGGSFLAQLNPELNLMGITDTALSGAIKDQVKPSMSYKDKLFGTPLSSNGWGFEGIFYSKKLFEELNLQIPTTKEEMFAVSEKIKQAGKVPFWVSAKDKWTTTQIPENYWAWMVKNNPQNNELISTNKLKLENTPEFVESLAVMREIVEKGYANEDYITATYDAGIKALVDGTAGMYPQGSWIFTALEANYPDQVDQIGFFPQPIDGNNVVAVSPPQGLFVSKNTKKIDAVTKWLNFYATEGQKIYYEKSKGLPMFNNVEADMWPAYKDIVTLFEAGNYAYNEQIGLPIMFPDWESSTQAAVTGDMTPQAAAKNLDKNFADANKLIGTPGW